ncbi:MAG: MFS transporter [Minisyncoccia bacterium]
MHPRAILTIGNFFSVAHFYLIIFILAPYLATLMPEAYTGLVIAGGALVTLALFPSAPKIIARVGARKLGLVCGGLEALILFLLACTIPPTFAIILSGMACALSPFIAYSLDLLLEATVRQSEEASTGKIRTAFLTAGNVALVAAPLLTGMLLDDGNAYHYVFLAASVSLIPFLFLFATQTFPEGSEPKTSNIRQTLWHIQHSKDLRSVIGANSVLQFFYHLAPVYVPLYLHNVLHIPWSSLGWIFSIALIPFILIEYPAGAIADRFLGDKKLLVLGFIIAGISFALVGLLTSTTPLIILVLILVATRVGAALIEAMTEGHFFRRVSERDADTVSVFRMGRPFAALVGPLLGSVILGVTGYTALFFITGTIILVLGILCTYGIQDVTKITVVSRSEFPQNPPA